MSPGDPRGERLQIMLSEDELKILDDFRFRERMPSRAAAVRELVKRGLGVVGFAPGAFGGKSADYGIMGDSPAKLQDGASAPARGSRGPGQPK
jgi:hypothetical protein